MIRVLQIVGRMDRGGAETFVMNMYRAMDRKKIQFDFVVHIQGKSDYESEIKELGGKIYHITPISKNIFRHMKDLYNILRNKKYAAVHRHTNASIVFIDLLVAKLCGVNVRIAHSHCDRTLTSRLVQFITKPLLIFFSTDKLACSNDAGKWLYGKNYTVINNGIDIRKYIFNSKVRDSIRSNRNITDKKIVIGHIGRFTYAKNHNLIIDIFNEIISRDADAELWLIGKGELEDEIKNKVEQLGINDKVKFWGSVANTNEILQAMDIFLFPSHYEGLGIALIEAQIAGLNSFVSDTIPRISHITDRISIVSLQSNAVEWADKILSVDVKNREINQQDKKVQMFNINKIAELLTSIYLRDSI